MPNGIASMGGTRRSLGGATTSFPTPTRMVTDVNAGDQSSALMGGGWDPLDLVRRLRQDKEASRRDAFRWDRQQAQLGGALQAAAPSTERNEPMPLRDMMQTKEILDRLAPFNIGGGTNLEFRQMPAAAAMTGMNLPESGFDVYTRLAGAGRGAGQQAGANLRQMRGLAAREPGPAGARGIATRSAGGLL